MSAEKISKAATLELATAAVADRGLNYGRPEDNFQRIADRWTAHVRNCGGTFKFTASNVAVMMIDVKLARLENTPSHLDSWVDLAGYAACGANIACEAPIAK
jgi:hypothetical protein